MSRKHKFKDKGKLYYITFAVVYWIDLFIREEYKKIFLHSWNYWLQNKGMELYGWCIMSSLVQHNNPVELSNQKMAWQKFEYIHTNPVKAGIVKKREDYYTAVQEIIRV